MPGRGYRDSTIALENHLRGQTQHLQPVQKLFHDRLQDVEGRINLLEVTQSPLKTVPLSKVELHTVGDVRKIRLFPETDLLRDFNNLTVKVIIHLYDNFSNHVDSRVVHIINNKVIRERYEQNPLLIKGQLYQVPFVVDEYKIFYINFEGRTVIDVELHGDLRKLIPGVLNSALMRADVAIVKNALFL